MPGGPDDVRQRRLISAGFTPRMIAKRDRLLFDELLSRTTAIELVAPPVWQAFTIINPILLATKLLRVRVA